MKISGSVISRSLAVLVVFVTMAMAILVHIPPAKADTTVQSYSRYTPAGGCAVTSASDISLTDQQFKAFQLGFGVVQGVADYYYKSQVKYSCCAEQVKRNPGISLVDLKCDEEFSKPQAADPKFASAGGNIYVRFGTMPNVTLPGVMATSQYIFGTRQNYASANNSNVNKAAGKVSASNYLMYNYDSPNIVPPGNTWYGYLKEIASNNLGSANVNTFATGGGLTQPAGALSNASTPLGSKLQEGKINVADGTGGVTISTGSVCDKRFMIFVKGNLTINAPFTVDPSNPNVGCMFIVEGKIIVENGSVGSTTVPGGPANKYDRLDAAFVTDNEFFSQYDNGQNGEGIKVTGSITAGSVIIKRDIGSTSWPSFYIEYDPRYIELFKTELKLTRFSIREKGFDL